MKTDLAGRNNVRLNPLKLENSQIKHALIDKSKHCLSVKEQF